MMLRSRKTLHGFTLIELLVVISIIALLISILLPALGNARDAARTVQCLSNQRQWGMTFAVYHNDFSGWYPYNLSERMEPAPDVNWSWAGAMWKEGYISTHRMLDCPTFDTSFPEEGWAYFDGNNHGHNFEANNVWRYMEYGYNIYHIGTSARYDDAPHWLPAKQDDLNNPSKTLITTDSFAHNEPNNRRGHYYVRDSFDTTTPDAGYVHLRHGDATAGLFGDGHVELVHQPDNPGNRDLWDRN